MVDNCLVSKASLNKTAACLSFYIVTVIIIIIFIIIIVVVVAAVVIFSTKLSDCFDSKSYIFLNLFCFCLFYFVLVFHLSKSGKEVIAPLANVTY